MKYFGFSGNNQTMNMDNIVLELLKEAVEFANRELGFGFGCTNAKGDEDNIALGAWDFAKSIIGNEKK